MVKPACTQNWCLQKRKECSTIFLLVGSFSFTFLRVLHSSATDFSSSFDLPSLSLNPCSWSSFRFPFLTFLPTSLYATVIETLQISLWGKSVLSVLYFLCNSYFNCHCTFFWLISSRHPCKYSDDDGAGKELAHVGRGKFATTMLLGGIFPCVARRYRERENKNPLRISSRNRYKYPGGNGGLLWRRGGGAADVVLDFPAAFLQRPQGRMRRKRTGDRRLLDSSCMRYLQSLPGDKEKPNNNNAGTPCADNGTVALVRSLCVVSNPGVQII